MIYVVQRCFCLHLCMNITRRLRGKCCISSFWVKMTTCVQCSHGQSRTSGSRSERLKCGQTLSPAPGWQPGPCCLKLTSGEALGRFGLAARSSRPADGNTTVTPQHGHDAAIRGGCAHRFRSSGHVSSLFCPRGSRPASTSASAVVST